MNNLLTAGFVNAAQDELRIDTQRPSTDTNVSQSQAAIHNKLRHLRQQFYNSGAVDHLRNKGLKRSVTERTTRDSGIGECSLDSGLSSPTGSSLSHEEPHPRQVRLTRHWSMDRADITRYNRYRSINDLETEAQSIQQIVDDLTSTKTMRRRRTESSSMTITDRRKRATESISSYTPIAPGESEWGLMFDEMIAKLKGYEINTDESHLCKATNCTSDFESSPPSAENNDSKFLLEHGNQPISKQEKSKSTSTLDDDVFSDDILDDKEMIADTVDTTPNEQNTTPNEQNTTPNEQSIIPNEQYTTPNEQNTTPDERNITLSKQNTTPNEWSTTPNKQHTTQTGRLYRSLTEKAYKTRDTVDMKSLMRSISFHRPDIATYNMPLSGIRRTDSDNDVWIERVTRSKNEPVQTVQPNITHNNDDRKQLNPWRKITKLFSFSKKSSRS